MNYIETSSQPESGEKKKNLGQRQQSRNKISCLLEASAPVNSISATASSSSSSSSCSSYSPALLFSMLYVLIIVQLVGQLHMFGNLQFERSECEGEGKTIFVPQVIYFFVLPKWIM